MNRGFLFRFFRMTSVVMLLIAAALLSAITTMHFAIHGAEVKIPSLKGMTVAVRHALIWVAVKNPAPGQERNF